MKVQIPGGCIGRVVLLDEVGDIQAAFPSLKELRDRSSWVEKNKFSDASRWYRCSDRCSDGLEIGNNFPRGGDEDEEATMPIS